MIRDILQVFLRVIKKKKHLDLTLGSQMVLMNTLVQLALHLFGFKDPFFTLWAAMMQLSSQSTVLSSRPIVMTR